MRFAETVRIGGKGALVIGVMSMSLMFGNSLGYYYGYSGVSFGVQQSSDPFGNQNVNYTPQVSMVSSQSQNQSYDYGTASYSTSVAAAPAYTGGFSALATSYGYAAPAVAQAPIYTTQSISSPSNYWGAVSNSAATSTVTFSSWNAAAGTAGMVTSNSSTSGGGGGFSGYYGGFGNYSQTVASTAPAPSVYDIVYSDYSSTSFNAGGWQAVNMTVVPRVANQISTPTVPTVTAPSPSTPTANLGDPLALSAPEPGTLLTMSAGLALLLFKFRRRK
jgi:hypothetical protein